MAYYLLGNLKEFSNECLTSLLQRDGKVFSQLASCREVINRNIQDRDFNIIMVEEQENNDTYFDAQEIVCDRIFLTELLQTIVSTNEPDKKITIKAGNRFIYWEKSCRMRSPIGSLISGILKIAVKHDIQAENYEEFKEKFIKATARAGNYLNNEATNVSLAIAIKLFSEYLMPSDPNSSSGALGTNQYLCSIKNSQYIESKEVSKELYKYFTEKLGLDVFFVKQFIRTED